MSGKGKLAWIESLLGQADHGRGILADGIEHDRVFKLGRHLADDVNVCGGVRFCNHTLISMTLFRRPVPIKRRFQWLVVEETICV